MSSNLLRLTDMAYGCYRPDNFANVAGAVNFACHNYWKEVVIIDNIDDNT